MPDAAESKRIRAERKAAGKCVGCGVRVPASKRLSCKQCLDKRKNWNKTDRAKNPAKYAESAREKRARLRSIGICIECTTAPAKADRAKCSNCLAKASERVKKSVKAKQAS